MPRQQPSVQAACAQKLGLAAERQRPADPGNFGERQPRNEQGRTPTTTTRPATTC